MTLSWNLFWFFVASQVVATFVIAAARLVVVAGLSILAGIIAALRTR